MPAQCLSPLDRSRWWGHDRWMPWWRSNDAPLVGKNRPFFPSETVATNDKTKNTAKKMGIFCCLPKVCNHFTETENPRWNCGFTKRRCFVFGAESQNGRLYLEWWRTGNDENDGRSERRVLSFHPRFSAARLLLQGYYFGASCFYQPYKRHW